MRDRSCARNGTSASVLEVELTRRIIGCAMAVHQELGPGFLESVYHRALAIELGVNKIEFESEKVIPISYCGQLVASHRLDLIVAGRIVVETKSVDRLDDAHVAQVLSYLRATRLRVGLLLNFRAVRLGQGIRRVVL